MPCNLCGSSNVKVLFHQDDYPDGYKQDLKMGLTFAIQDLKTSWKWYRMAYEKEIEHEERDRH